MFSELPLPIITTEELKFSKTDIETKTVHSWSCSKCGRQLGKFSAQRSWELHGEILCGECVQDVNIGYKEWLREQEIIKSMQEA